MSNGKDMIIILIAGLIKTTMKFLNESFKCNLLNEIFKFYKWNSINEIF